MLKRVSYRWSVVNSKNIIRTKMKSLKELKWSHDWLKRHNATWGSEGETEGARSKSLKYLLFNSGAKHTIQTPKSTRRSPLFFCWLEKETHWSHAWSYDIINKYSSKGNFRSCEYFIFYIFLILCGMMINNFVFYVCKWRLFFR